MQVLEYKMKKKKRNIFIGKRNDKLNAFMIKVYRYPMNNNDDRNCCYANV